MDETLNHITSSILDTCRNSTKLLTLLVTASKDIDTLKIPKLVKEKFHEIDTRNILDLIDSIEKTRFGDFFKDALGKNNSIFEEVKKISDEREFSAFNGLSSTSKELFERVREDLQLGSINDFHYSIFTDSILYRNFVTSEIDLNDEVGRYSLNNARKEYIPLKISTSYVKFSVKNNVPLNTERKSKELIGNFDISDSDLEREVDFLTNDMKLDIKRYFRSDNYFEVIDNANKTCGRIIEETERTRRLVDDIKKNMEDRLAELNKMGNSYGNYKPKPSEEFFSRIIKDSIEHEKIQLMNMGVLFDFIEKEALSLITAAVEVAKLYNKTVDRLISTGAIKKTRK